MEKALPLGSKVRVKNNRVYMIIGYSPNRPIDDEANDYICCSPYKGIVKSESKIEKDKDYFFIKKEDIKEVLYIGYSDEIFDLYEYSLYICNSNLRTVKLKHKKMGKQEVEEFCLECLKDIKKIGDKNEL